MCEEKNPQNNKKQTKQARRVCPQQLASFKEVTRQYTHTKIPMSILDKKNLQSVQTHTASLQHQVKKKKKKNLLVTENAEGCHMRKTSQENLKDGSQFRLTASKGHNPNSNAMTVTGP